MHDLFACVGKQEKGKSLGLDNTAMESFIYDGLKLLLHVCFYRVMHVVLARYCYRKTSVRPSVCLSGGI